MKVKNSRTNCSPKVILSDPDLVLFVSSGNIRRRGQRESLLHCSVYPVSPSLYLNEGQVSLAVPIV